MRLFFVALLSTLACAHQKPLHAEHGESHHREGFHKRFDDAEAWAAVFDDPARDAWQKPDEVIRELALPKDAKVADIGAGTGYFAARIARVVTEGMVYATDVEPDMVRYLGERAKRDNVPNLKPVLSTADDANIPEAVDFILVVNTYHHIGNRPDYFKRLTSKLKPAGRVVIIDFTKESVNGPPPHARITADEVMTELATAGLRLQRAPEVLPEQYLLIFERTR